MADALKPRVTFVLDFDDHWDNVQKWSAIDSYERWHGSVGVKGKKGQKQAFSAIVADPKYRTIKADSFKHAKSIVCARAGVQEMRDG